MLRVIYFRVNRAKWKACSQVYGLPFSTFILIYHRSAARFDTFFYTSGERMSPLLCYRENASREMLISRLTRCEERRERAQKACFLFSDVTVLARVTNCFRSRKVAQAVACIRPDPDWSWCTSRRGANPFVRLVRLTCETSNFKYQFCSVANNKRDPLCFLAHSFLFGASTADRFSLLCLFSYFTFIRWATGSCFFFLPCFST